jgi:hypothetical protein
MFEMHYLITGKYSILLLCKLCFHPLAVVYFHVYNCCQVYFGRATWEACSGNLECLEPSQYSLLNTGKPSKTCVEVTGRRTFRILTASRQSGIWSKTSIWWSRNNSIKPTQTCCWQAAFGGGKWGDRPRPRASGLRSSLWVCQALFPGKLEMPIHAPFKILLQSQIPECSAWMSFVS